MKPFAAMRMRQSGGFTPVGPISFVGSASGSTSTGGTTVNFSSLVDAGGGTPTLQQGDLVILVQGNRAPVGGTPSTPTGYTNAFGQTSAGSTNRTTLRIDYKFMGATPDTSVSIPSFASGAGAYTIHVLRGVSMGATLDGVTPVSAATVNASASPNAPSITPVTAGDWIFVAAAASGAAGSVNVLTNPANLSGTAHHFASAINSTATGGAGLKTDWVSGAFDPDAFGGGTTSTVSAVVGAAMVLKSA